MVNEGRNEEWLLMGTGVSLWDDENVLKWDSSDSYTTLNILKKKKNLNCTIEVSGHYSMWIKPE